MTKEEIISYLIGIAVDAKDLTPMDKGECMKAMDIYATQKAREMAEKYVKWWAKKIQYPNPADREPFTYDLFLSENNLQEEGKK